MEQEQKLSRSQLRRDYLREAKRRSRALIYENNPESYQLDLEQARERMRMRRLSTDPDALRVYWREQKRESRKRLKIIHKV